MAVQKVASSPVVKDVVYVYFQDGPLRLHKQEVTRDPYFLRVTIKDKQALVMDRQDDQAIGEIVLYEKSEPSVVTTWHTRYSDGHKGQHQETYAYYRLTDIQPEQEIMSNTQRWQQWAIRELKRIEDEQRPN
jgi:hypothetical protein